MGLDNKEQTELYNNYWFKMEQSFGTDNYAALFDRFMRDYLTVKTGQIPNIRDIYTSFKDYASSHNLVIADLVADIYRFARFFTRLAFGSQTDTPKVIRQALADLNVLRVEVAYPFLLEVYDDFDRQRIDEATFEQIIRLVESYVLRRAICGIPTNSLNKTFATLSKEIDKQQYLESLKAAFLKKEGYLRFPSDEEFQNQFVLRDIYNSLRRNYILRKLENYGYHETVNIEDYTIEHIMPQNPNLSVEWQEMLGSGSWKEVRDKYLHTIGNLTLTGYNSALSDRPFLEKRDMPDGGFAFSPVRLNQSLKNLTVWNEEEIQRRAAKLSERAVKVWAAPSLPTATLESYRRHQNRQW